MMNRIATSIVLSMLALTGCRTATEQRARPEIRREVESAKDEAGRIGKVETIYLGDVPLYTSITINGVEVMHSYSIDGGRSVCERDTNGDGVFEDVRVWQGPGTIYSAFHRSADGEIAHYSDDELKTAKLTSMRYLDMHRRFLKAISKYLRQR
jgi:hypothetical protein